MEPAGQGRLIQRAVLAEIAAKHRKTPAQVVIRWHLDSGLIAIPKTVRLERLKENIGALDFRLDADDMRRIDALDSPGEDGARSGDGGFLIPIERDVLRPRTWSSS